MASLPSFDNSLFSPPVDAAALTRVYTAPGHPSLEHATQLASPPGSTFKLVVAGTDVATGMVDPFLVVPTGYEFQLGGATFHGWGWLPPQNLSQAIAWSNDVYFYKLALTLGPERIQQVGAQLGAGVSTGIDLPGEDEGLVATPHSVQRDGGTWYPGNAISMGIGQGFVTATPLQVARWSAAIGSGTLVNPHLGLATRTTGRDQWLRLGFPAPSVLPFADRLGPVRDGMRQAVFAIDPQVHDLPFPAGVKTGTAEDASTMSGDTDSWFLANSPFTGTDVTAVVFAHGGGQGYLSGDAVRGLLAHYYANRGAATATPAR
jgi:cell division protein FtsI/penicillin-binding protein 2